tara:strand:- start:10794 stop:11450 length:657 start_codon:yes stop_codon:yes gene_type:complete
MSSSLLTNSASGALPIDSAPRISKSELRRRLWHMSPGLLPFVFAAIPHKDPLSLDARAIMVSVAAIIAFSLLRDTRNIARTRNENLTSNVLGYLIPVVSLLVLFPATPELGMTLLAILAFGDGFATVGGLLLKGPALPWNREKTWAGLISFLICAAPLALLAFVANSSPTPELSPALAVAVAAAVTGAIAESLPLRINDNVSVGAAGTVAILAAHLVT